MVDVRGTAYSDTPNAFKFRTEYDSACTCHGHPWEAAAQERHRVMAEAAAIADKPQELQSPRPVEIAALDPVITTVFPTKPAPTPVVALLPAPTAAAKTESAAMSQPIHPSKSKSQPLAVQQATASAIEAPLLSPRKPGAKPKQILAAKNVTTKKKTAVLRSAPEVAAIRPVVTQRAEVKPAKFDVSQRSFRSPDYWRLSYWDASN